MGDFGKKAMSLNIFNPLMHHYGAGHFESSRPGDRSAFAGVANPGKMTKQQRKDYLARQSAKNPATRTPLSSRYS